MKKKMKKAFTLVELLVVIAILAVLSTVAIVGYNSFTEKARISNDKTLVTQLNKLLQADEAADGKAKFANDALAVVAENGFDVKKMTPTTDDYDIVWNEESNRFVLLDNKGAEVVETLSAKAHLNWQFSSDTTPVKEGFSIYLNDKFVGTEVTVSSGLDVGSHTGIETINYITNDTEEVTFRTNGGTLNIDAPNATVNHYGTAVVVNVNDVASSTYNLFGEAQFVKVADGEHVVLKSGSTVNTVYVAGTNNKVEAQNGQTGNVYTSADGSEEDIKTSGTLFAGGLGTEASPYLIKNVKQLANINELYNKGFYNFKIANSVETLDLTGWGTVKLNGNFDGNGVKLLNVSNALFYTVGHANETKDIKISNLDATMNNTEGRALVRNIFNCGTTTFENVNVHGYIEGSYNLGSFYNYGVANAGNSDGADYTVNFVNSKSDVTLVNTTGNAIGGMLGHGYQGEDYTLTINMDENSYYNGTMYSTGTAVCYQVMAMCSTQDYVLNNVVTSRYTNEYPSIKLASVNPTNTENGYEIAVQPNVSKVVVSFNCQISVHDENNVRIDNKSGLTWVVAKEEITDLADKVNVFNEKYDSFAIVNGNDKDCSIDVVNGVLTLYTGSNENYKSGTLTMFIYQYDATGNIVAVGSTKLGDIPYNA